MKYCDKCVQPNTRPRIVFQGDTCLACVNHAFRAEIDWERRFEDLQDISLWAKKQRKDYDCVIGVSGGRDSHVQAWVAKEVLELHPLLVSNTPDVLSETGRKNLENLVKMGFDLISVRVNPKIMNAVIKEGFYKFGNPVKGTESSLWASAYRVAYQYDIPLVIQGENPAFTLGLDAYQGGDAMRIFNHNTVSDGLDWMGLSKKESFPFSAPTMGELRESGMRAIFLSHYYKSWGWNNNTVAAIGMGLEKHPDYTPEKVGRLNPYISVDAELQVVNQYLKYLKFGFGFVTDEVSYAIREGGMTREEGIELVKKYDGKIDGKYISDFCKYLSISEDTFWLVTDSFVNTSLFKREREAWVPEFTVGENDTN